ncbi:MAG TPA: hypothetical protein VI911_11845 [Patescibacteria group bacterium]|nr:hypothetical protein [Patescibacteria group bacterium]
MKKLKVFVGIDGRWVLCEKFPDDEEHGGLEEMLTDLISECIEVEEKMGFYLMSFKMAYWDNPEDGGYLDIDKLEKNKESP